MSGAASPLPASPSTKLKLHPTPSSASQAARSSIINSSAKGWSPLQINKRDSVTSSSSPLRQSQTGFPTSPSDGPRRTSSSFKHVTRNSLVSKSPFKSTATIQGQQAAGIYDPSPEKVIHQRHSATPRSLGTSPEKAVGAPSTPRAAIGLGTPSGGAQGSSSNGRPSTPTGSEHPSQTSTPNRIASGLRRVSSDKLGINFGSDRKNTSSTPETKNKKDRIVDTKENDSPDVRSDKKTPRQSVGRLAQNEYVSKSPFLSTAKRIFSGEKKNSPKSSSVNSPKAQVPVERDDVFGTPSQGARVLRKSSGELRGSTENMARRVPSSENMARRSSSSSTSAKSENRRVSPSKPSPATARMVSASSTPSGSPSRGISEFGSPIGGSPSPARRGPSLAINTGAVSSPLGRPDSEYDLAPVPVPMRSAMTPSRRLFGPREWSGLSQDSPTKSKAVTFSSVAHVREFEPLSNENSLDGSFDSPPPAAAGWMMGHESLDEMLNENVGDESFGSIGSIGSISVGSIGSSGSIDSLSRLRVTNPDEPSPDRQGHESTTADFVNTLIEEGLFTPSAAQTPAMAEPLSFEDPPSVPEETPTVEGDNQVTPLWMQSDLPQSFEERDPAGIPYGRSHHSERAAAAHAHPVHPGHIAQPQLPRQSDSHLLLNGDAAKPSIPYATPFDSQPIHSHQAGPLPDPFITIQTATKVLSPPHKARDEGGVPLGRTSHAERVQAARMLATQSLGLGYPRGNPASSPNSPSAPTFSAPSPPSPEESINQSEETRPSPSPESADYEDAMYDVNLNEDDVTVLPTSSVPAPVVRTLPPTPSQIDLPTPVSKPQVAETEGDVKTEVLEEQVDDQEQEVEVKTAEPSKIFSLPFINKISPFFSQQATVPTPAHPADESFSGSEMEDDDEPQSKGPAPPARFASEVKTPEPAVEKEDDEPLTPPPAINQQKKPDSPHRIPSFDFEKISLHTVEPPTFQTARIISPTKIRPATKEIEESSVSTHSKFSPSTTASTFSSPATSLALSAENKATPSFVLPPIPTTRTPPFAAAPTLPAGDDFGIVSHSKTTSPQASPQAATTNDSTTTRIRQRISREMIRETINQRIADGSISRRGSAQVLSTTSSDLHSQTRRPLSISVTPSSNNNPLSLVPESPSQQSALSPRSAQSAHDVLKASVRDGVIDEPQSALDKIIALGSPTSPVGPRSSSSTTVLMGDRNKVPEIRARSPTPVREEPPPAKGVTPRSSSSASRSSTGSKKSRRSLSTSELGDSLEPPRQIRRARSNPRLSLGIDAEDISMLQAFNEEAANIGSDRGYKIKEKEGIKASYGQQIGHGRSASEAEARAWKSIRRPSDMNEHAAQIRAIRQRQVSNGKTSGTIFVKVLGIEGLVIPTPDLPTYFCVTLDNGIDYIRTPYSVLKDGAKINQEFSLVEHPNFEFSLSLEIRRDPHVLKLIHDRANPAPPSITSASSKSSSGHGFRGLFSSPRKARKGEDRWSRSGTPQPSNTSVGGDSLAKFFATPNSSTVAKTHVVFKPIAKNCDAKVLEIRYPMFAMFKGEADRPAGGHSASNSQNGQRQQVAKITLQIFRLPPLPGLTMEDLPTCIDDAVRGIRHHAWHECEYHEGVLTQEGGDCSIPRRRLFKLVGGNLVAINEVTKKHVISIDLRKATQVIDLNAADPYSEPVKNGSPMSKATTARKWSDGDEFGTKPRSFRLEFDDDWIDFWADKQEDKDVWISTFKGLIGKIPSNPLWADLLAARYRDKAIRRSVSTNIKKP